MYNKYRGDLYMKPRIFVSSTFYDLKYIREDLANFIRAHDFEPVMFEEGDIGYTPGNPLDDSCYEAMRNSDMAILIIGGQYGSVATGEKNKTGEFISVTHKEYNEAIKRSVPVYCFIDKSVLAEYQVYKLNKSKINNNTDYLEFQATKDVNVFRFIDDIYKIGHISITPFEKSEEIKDFMGKQWADMFKKYLEYLKNKNDSEKLNSTVDDMNTILKQMKIMINRIGEDTIKNDSDYKKILDEQQILELENLADIITKSIKILPTAVNKSKVVYHILNVLKTVTNEMNIDIAMDIDNESDMRDKFYILFLRSTEILIEKNIQVIGIKNLLFDNFALLIKYLNDQDLFDKLKSIILKDKYFNNFFD